MQQHIKYAVVDLDSLEPFSGNARRHNDAALKTSVQVHGQFRTLVVREVEDDDGTKHHVLLCGHGTADAMRANGHTKARVEIVACSDEEALQINLAENRLNDLAEYDEDSLAAQLAEISTMDLWDGTGWDEKAAAKYLNGDAEEEGGEPAPEGWAIIVNCRDEAEQAILLDRFTEEGLDVKALVT